jgi:hypothetical protein
MNRGERGFLREAIEAWRCSASLLRALCGEMENVRSPGSRSALILRKKRAHSHSRPTFPVCTLGLNRVSPSRCRRMFRFTDLRSIRSWRIAD